MLAHVEDWNRSRLAQGGKAQPLTKAVLIKKHLVYIIQLFAPHPAPVLSLFVSRRFMSPVLEALHDFFQLGVCSSCCLHRDEQGNCGQNLSSTGFQSQPPGSRQRTLSCLSPKRSAIPPTSSVSTDDRRIYRSSRGPKVFFSRSRCSGGIGSEGRSRNIERREEECR